MKRLRWFALLVTGGLALLAFPLAAQADSSPYLVFAEDFETPGLPGWNFWVSSGEGSVQSGPEQPNLGSTAPNNDLLAGFFAAPGENFVGGIWTTVPVPLGIPLIIDGFWRSDGSAQMSLFAYDYDGTNAPVSGFPHHFRRLPRFIPPAPDRSTASCSTPTVARWLRTTANTPSLRGRPPASC